MEVLDKGGEVGTVGFSSIRFVRIHSHHGGKLKATEASKQNTKSFLVLNKNLLLDIFQGSIGQLILTTNCGTIQRLHFLTESACCNHCSHYLFKPAKSESQTIQI